jgi:uncharacterized protein
MSELLPLFLAGLLGGTHCFGMCGGIVAALSGGAGGPAGPRATGGTRWPLLFAYNGGRITSYMLAGALLGGLAGLLGDAGGALAGLHGQWPWRLLLLVLANLLLVAMGLYLMGLPQLLLPLERGGSLLWRRVQPLGRRFLPAQRVAQALPLGLIWGWLPCGLVYSALATALASGSVAGGAATMLAFGLGTLPNLLLAGAFAAQVGRFTRQAAVRRVAGAIVLGFGVHGLVGAWRMAQATGLL